MLVNKLTPVLFVDRIEPCLPFWMERLGFKQTAAVPGDDGSVFVMLRSAGVEVMYQTWASLDADAACRAMAAALRKGQTFLFVEVKSIADTIAALEGVEIVMPLRKTFYGSAEIGVAEPGGHFVTFAKMTTAE